MYKFSIIVPIYNVEKYLNRCLDSLVNQNYDNYEIILVNDGSTDNSQSIIDEYQKKYNVIKCYKKNNGGLSDARNFGVLKASGKYLIFVDSDDYVSVDMLNILDSHLLNGDYDLVKFNYAEVNDEGLVTDKSINMGFNDNGGNVFLKLCEQKIPFEMAWLYAYNRDFFINNNFKYMKGKIHEDFGLTPLILLKAQSCLVISNILYYYYVSSNSITRNNLYEKKVKMANDYLDHFDYLLASVNNLNNVDLVVQNYFKSYIANGVLMKAKSLKKNDFNNYVKEIKKRNVSQLVIDNTFFRRLKKILLGFSIRLYLMLF